MPKASISTVHAAERLYKKGKTYNEIAKKLDISAKTVGDWKKKYGWTRPEQSSSGAPKRNKNAVGTGAPKGNQNAKTHGGYGKLLLSSLTDEEAEYFDDDKTENEEEMLIAEIRLLDIRIARLMKQINDFQKKKGGLYVESVSTHEDKRRFDNDDDEELYNERIQQKVAAGERLPGKPYSVHTTTRNIDEFILSIQEAINRVQSQKSRCIDMLHKIRQTSASGKGKSVENNLLEALTSYTMEEFDTSDIPELQQAPEFGDDMVE